MHNTRKLFSSESVLLYTYRRIVYTLMRNNVQVPDPNVHSVYGHASAQVIPGKKLSPTHNYNMSETPRKHQRTTASQKKNKTDTPSKNNEHATQT